MTARHVVRNISPSIDMFSFLLQQPLGAYSRCLFVDEETEEAISRFHAKLHEASQAISDRNRAREWPYPCLLPESVSNTIH